MRHAIGDGTGFDTNWQNCVREWMSEAIDMPVSEPDDWREPTAVQCRHEIAYPQILHRDFAARRQDAGATSKNMAR